MPIQNGSLALNMGGRSRWLPCHSPACYHLAMIKLIILAVLLLFQIQAVAAEQTGSSADFYDNKGNFTGRVRPETPASQDVKVMTDKYGNQIGKARSYDGGKTWEVRDRYGNLKGTVRSQ